MGECRDDVVGGCVFLLCVWGWRGRVVKEIGGRRLGVMMCNWVRLVQLVGVTGIYCGHAQVVGQVIHEDHLLVSSDGSAEDQLGWSIAVDQGVVGVGAWHDDDLGSDSGSVYLFDAMSGAFLDKLIADDGASGDVFGVSLAMGDGFVVVGARDHDDGGSNTGAAYVFDASTGGQVFEFRASDAAIGDRYGRAVAIDGGLVGVGSPLDDDLGSNSGSVYLYDVSSGVEVAKLVASDGEGGDRFGFSMAMDSGLVVVGAYHDHVDGVESGSVYIFDAMTGKELHKLVPSDGVANGLFGRVVDVSGGLVVVGASDDSSGAGNGAAYVFDAQSGVELFKLMPGDGMVGTDFGNSVSVDGLVVGVGAPFESSQGFGSGLVYLFSGTTGKEIAQLSLSDGMGLDFFGISVSIGQGVVGAGAMGRDSVGVGAVFDLRCPADLTGEGVLDFFDVSAFIQGYANRDPIADWTGDGEFDFFDVSAFLDAFAQGCPLSI